MEERGRRVFAATDQSMNPLHTLVIGSGIHCSNNLLVAALLTILGVELMIDARWDEAKRRSKW